MPIRITKPPVNIREKLAELERPIGLNGSALMRTETLQEAFSLIGAGRKNLIINGSMNIWQRGTSLLNLASQGATNYTADRWNATRYSSGDHDVTRQEVNHLGFRYALRSERSVGDSGATARFINQPIESSISRTLAGKYVTLSFYARRGAGMPTISGVNLSAWIVYHVEDNYLNNGMFYSNFKNATTITASSKNLLLSTDFQKFELTEFIPSNVRQIGISFGTPVELPTAIANDYFEITGVQLEEGRTATPFEFLLPMEELSLCQRYYCKSFNVETEPANGITSGDGEHQIHLVASGDPQIVVYWPVTMRSSPTITLYNPRSGGASSQWSTAASDSANARAFYATQTKAIIDNSDVSLSATYWRIAWSASAEL
jgi:hypothetical protein